MLTAGGAGPSFCAATPSPRLKPKTSNSPRGVSPQHKQYPPLSNSTPHAQENPVPPTPVLHLLLTRTKSALSDSGPDSNANSQLADSSDDWEDNLSQSSRDDTFFGPQSPTTLTEFLEHPSPKSFYSVATSSSEGTARGIPPSSFEVPSYPPLPRPSELLQHSSQRFGAKRANNSRQLDSCQRDNLAADIFSPDRRSSTGRTRRRSKPRDLNMTSNHGREICIAVVGAPGVGKTTFIQKAYDLQRLPSRDSLSSKSIMVDKIMTEVKLVEFDWTQLHLDSDPLLWPKLGAGQRLPFVDGVLILYDVTDRKSLERVPELLDAFNNASLPNLLVSCKCDAPLSKRQIDPQAIEHVLAPGPFGGVEAMQTSANAIDSQKKCMATILNMVIARRNVRNSRYLNGRRRANSSATNTSRTTSPRPSTAKSGHSRASSEFSATLLKEFPQAPLHGSPHGQRISRSPMGHPLHLSSGQPSMPPQTSALNNPGDGGFGFMGSGQSSTSSPMPEIVYTQPFSSQPISSRSSQAPTTKPRSGSFLDIEDDASIKDPDDVPILEREESLSEDADDENKTPRSNGFTLGELVDRLLTEKMSKADQNFVTVFLCFYRKIAPPRDLFDSILDRFEKANSDTILLSRVNTQLRYCAVINQWVQSHPGDFAHPQTRQRLLNFLDVISHSRTFALLAKEIQQHLVNVVEDEDDMWGRSDAEFDRDTLGNGEAFLDSSHKATDTRWSAQINMEKPGSSLRIPRVEHEITRRASDATSHMSVSSQSTITPLIREPHTSGVGGILKEQYDQFMLTPDEEIAAELTRIDWSEFSQIRPRDLVRHVSIPADQKEKYRSLVHVNRMISHFNHVAYWVANVILEKPKPKYRGRALEKFMEIAWILRHKNNYNALGAVIAGINGTAVHRLSLTRVHVNATVHKKFMRLELLMGSHKSHFSYRLALENTSSERIPFIPLHRRDLVSAEEGNKTFLQDGERINWNKFQLMGDILMVIIKSQTNPYTSLVRNPTVEKLILDAAISTNDDELYERSVALENMGQASRRGAWFRR